MFSDYLPTGITDRDCEGPEYPDPPDSVVERQKIFPFEYVGGGYFRKKGVQKGGTAELLHGMEAIDYVIRMLKGA